MSVILIYEEPVICDVLIIWYCEAWIMHDILQHYLLASVVSNQVSQGERVNLLCTW